MTVGSSGAAGSKSDGRTWQPYTDSVVHAVLMAVPWGGAELVGAADDQTELRQEVKDLLEDVTAYMDVRPRSQQPGLAPFFPSAGMADDATSRCDSCLLRTERRDRVMDRMSRIRLRIALRHYWRGAWGRLRVASLLKL